jgi:hypothetical protein
VLRDGSRRVRLELQESFRSVLEETDWAIREDPADADRQSLLFTYPLGLEENLYSPRRSQPVQPYIESRLQRYTFYGLPITTQPPWPQLLIVFINKYIMF